MYQISLSVLFVLPLLVSSVFGKEQTITGIVRSHTNGKPVELANIILEDGRGTYTDEQGRFVIATSQIPIRITIAHIAYCDTVLLVLKGDCGEIWLTPTYLPIDQVIVTATRAVKGKTPVAFSEVSSAEIHDRYTVEDVPMILAQEPGVFAYSESGNGTGYSYVQIRGFDQSRIAVMLNDVPLNDNESHQVYWVDHTDILSDAGDVQIQRGIGNSLYGSAAFGGSINVQSAPGTDNPVMKIEIGSGSYHTTKMHLSLSSGRRGRWRCSTRLAQVTSDGYREEHSSFQRAATGAITYEGKNIDHQFRTLLGYENCHLMWDGVAAEDIHDRERRRAGYKSYTDDFFQQIYSLSSRWKISEQVLFNNVVYLVKGRGYYETRKSTGYDLSDSDSTDWFDFRDFLYAYNLDGRLTNDHQQRTLTFTRRKWIENEYYGVIPTMTWLSNNMRLDVGGELRFYAGDHHGEIAHFSDAELSDLIGRSWFRYYRYFGTKSIATAFAHIAYNPVDRLKLISDLQFQQVKWGLDQYKIGHAVGYDVSAFWNFVNPRLGAIYSVSDHSAVFVNYGRAQREPADDQIISADDVWSQPQQTAAELIDDYEAGCNIIFNKITIDLNLYGIRYRNEQLKNIDVEQEGEYSYKRAAATDHSGLEWEMRYQPTYRWNVVLNGSWSRNKFLSGPNRGKSLPNVPAVLFNSICSVNLMKNLSLALLIRHVGKQFLDEQNIGVNPAYWLVDAGLHYKIRRLAFNVKVNNLLNTLYATYGYGYEWNGYQAYYWPGATRNGFFSIAYLIGE